MEPLERALGIPSVQRHDRGKGEAGVPFTARVNTPVRVMAKPKVCETQVNPQKSPGVLAIQIPPSIMITPNMEMSASQGVMKWEAW